MEFDIIDYVNAPPDRATLAQLIKMLPDGPAELVRIDQRFKVLGLDSRAYRTREDVINLLLKHPELLQRPIAVLSGRAVIARPAERVLELLRAP